MQHFPSFTGHTRRLLLATVTIAAAAASAVAHAEVIPAERRERRRARPAVLWRRLTTATRAWEASSSR